MSKGLFKNKSSDIEKQVVNQYSQKSELATFVRISASENTFLFVDATNEVPSLISKKFGFNSISEFVRSWCLGSKGLSADGFVFVTSPNSNEVNYCWDFYNCDGSTAEMCGNASRAMHLYVGKYLDFRDKILKFGTSAGLVSSEILGEKVVKVEMPIWKIIEENVVQKINSETVEATLLNTGVPHLVIEVKDINNQTKNLTLAKTFRFYELTGPKGTNVTFYQRGGDFKIFATSFERGVEGFTKSCGTGAVAAAITFLLKMKERRQISQLGEHQVALKVPGGDLKVVVDFENQRAYLIGEVQINYEIRPF
jgi:diaminopimelate epimerase